MEFSYKVLHIDASTGKFRIEEMKDDVLGPIDAGVRLHLEVFESYKYDVYHPNNVLLVGKGPFAGGMLYGSHRLIAVFRSPLTRGLHVSAVGGAAYRFMRTGVDAVCIEGKAESPTLVFIKGDESGKVEVETATIGTEKLLEIYKDYKGMKGTKALASFIMDNYWDFIYENKARMIIVGPAALRTSFAGLYVPNLDYEAKSILVEDWAARGGGGSVLFRAHGVVGIIGGGRYQPKYPGKDVTRYMIADSLVVEAYGKTLIEALYTATTKYRYDNEFRSGGTFGINYPHYSDKVPIFNWKMIYLSREERQKLHDLLMKHFYEPFKREAIDTGSWFTCGEPCPVKCKKVRSGRHNDYEPYNAAGPMIGILDIYEADRVIEEIDALGLDAIETGNLLGWLFEALERGLLEPDDLGVDRKPFLDPKNYRVEYSKHNAALAIKILRELVYGDREIPRLIAERGLRAAAKILDERFKERVERAGVKFEDIAMYVPYGKEGHITPNYYWTPGMIAPLMILGRYWTYYGNIFTDPEDFATVAFESAIDEYAIDNAGWCRFHRHWVGELLAKFYKDVWGISVDPSEHARKYYRMIATYQKKAGALPEFWDGRRMIEAMVAAACDFGPKEWCERFKKDMMGAAREWWERFRRKVEELLGEKVFSE